MNTARELDTADRYLNSKTVKYYLRAGDVAKAEELAALFTRQEEAVNPIQFLSEMQCIWFETEEATVSARRLEFLDFFFSKRVINQFLPCVHVQALLRSGAVGKALKKLHLVDSHFLQYADDQFDFHSYCFRKMTLRAYIR